MVRKLFNLDPTKLTEFKSSKGKYTALLPGTPQESQQKVNTPAGRIDLYITQAKGKFHQFIVAYCDYPQHVVDDGFPEKMLNSARDGAVRNVLGELLSETVFNFQGYEGRELHVKANPKIVMRMRMAMVGKRLYQWQIVCAPGNIHSKKAMEFLSGFRVDGLPVLKEKKNRLTNDMQDKEK